MKNISAMLCALALLGSANAMAQTNSGDTNATNPATNPGSTPEQMQGITPGAKQGIEPGKAGDSMNQLGSPPSGASSPQGSLMQKREQGMSPQGKGSQGTQGSSGSMKQ